MRSVLHDVPKVLAPVCGRPFLHYLLDTMARQGITRVVLATGHAAEAVETAASAFRGAIDLRFSRETEALGTGGAIAQAFEMIRGQRAWALNGDSFSDVDLGAVSIAAAWRNASRTGWRKKGAVEKTSLAVGRRLDLVTAERPF